MSVYNRKMFKRNARDTLNKSAGIADMPVQKFQAGGSIRIGNNNFMISPGANPKVFQRTGQGTAIPVNPNVAAQVLAQFRSPQLNTRSKFAASTGSSLPMGTVGTSGKVTLDQDQAAGIASLIEQQQDPNRPSTSLVESALRPNAPVQFEERYPLSSATEQFLFGQGAPKTMEGKALRTAVTSIPTMLDFVGVPLLETASQSQAGIDRALSMMTPEREEELLSGAGTLTDKEAAKFNADPTLVPPRLRAALIGGDVESGGVDLIKIGATGTSSGQYSVGEISPEQEAAGLAVAGATPGSQVGVTTTGPTFGTIREAGTYDKTYDAGAAAPTPDEVAEGEVAEGEVAGATTEEDREAIREAGTYEKEYPTTKEQVESIITEGTPEEQEKTLADFMKEFEENAPGYGSNNQGLILAKMGFAMAAGKSPRAIENIAAAMEQGADDLIKDNAKRDEYKRQIKLSALKYGLQETGKLKAEERAIAKERRGIVDYVAGPDGTFYKGREYGPNETVPVSVGDIRDGNLPAGVLSTATLDSLAKQATAYNKTLTSLREQRSISPSEYDKQLGAYNEAVTTAIQSETGIALLEGAMINVAEGKVTGVTPALKDMLNRGSNFFGMELGKDYETKDDVRNAMRASLQDLIPVTLGSSQTANSISNRDVDFLIEAYFGKSALDGGVLTFATTDPDQMVKRLQRAANKMRQEQKNAFTIMSQKEAQLAPLYQPGTQVSAANLLAADQQRLAEAGLTPQGGISKTSFGYTMGDDGVLRYTN